MVRNEGAWNRNRSHAVLLGAGAMLAVAALSQPASADCDEDADCEHGFVCEKYTAACPDIFGADCSNEEYSACVLGPCETDADCAEGMLCLASTIWQCDEGRQNCGEAEVFNCGPRWAAPCEVSADCGEGFSCVDEEQCGCMGGSSSGGGTSDSAGTRESVEDLEARPWDAQCSCEPTGRRVCELQKLECDRDSDCPSSMTCRTDPSFPVCSAAGNAPMAEPGIARETATPEAGTTACNDVEPPSVCLPPDYYGVGIDLTFGGELALTRDAAGTGASDDASPDSASTTGAESTSAGSPSAGCQVGNGNAAGAGGLAWLLLALVGLRRRKSV